MTSQTENTNNETNSTNQNSQSYQNSQSSQSAQDSGKELIDELTRLGQKFVDVIEVAWNSEQRKKVEEDLRTGLVTVATSLEDGFKRVSSTREAQEAVNAAEEVAEKVRTSKIASELSEALAQGLRALSDQMDKLSNEMKKSNAAGTQSTSKPTPNEPQDIPIARDE